jgi:hypothetical protein
VAQHSLSCLAPVASLFLLSASIPKEKVSTKRRSPLHAIVLGSHGEVLTRAVDSCSPRILLSLFFSVKCDLTMKSFAAHRIHTALVESCPLTSSHGMADVQSGVDVPTPPVLVGYVGHTARTQLLGEDHTSECTRDYQCCSCGGGMCMACSIVCLACNRLSCGHCLPASFGVTHCRPCCAAFLALPSAKL